MGIVSNPGKVYSLLFMNWAWVAQTVYIFVSDAISCNAGCNWRGPESSATSPSVVREDPHFSAMSVSSVAAWETCYC